MSSTLLPACRIGTPHQRTALQALQLLIFLLSSGAVSAPQQVSELCHDMAARTLPYPVPLCSPPLVSGPHWIWHAHRVLLWVACTWQSR